MTAVFYLKLILYLAPLQGNMSPMALLFIFMVSQTCEHMINHLNDLEFYQKVLCPGNPCCWANQHGWSFCLCVLRYASAQFLDFHTQYLRISLPNGCKLMVPQVPFPHTAFPIALNGNSLFPVGQAPNLRILLFSYTSPVCQTFKNEYTQIESLLTPSLLPH